MTIANDAQGAERPKRDPVFIPSETFTRSIGFFVASARVEAVDLPEAVPEALPERGHDPVRPIRRPSAY